MNTTACSSDDQRGGNAGKTLPNTDLDSTAEHVPSAHSGMCADLPAAAADQRPALPNKMRLDAADPILAGFLTSSDLVLDEDNKPAQPAGPQKTLPTQVKNQTKPAEMAVSAHELGQFLLPPERPDELGRLGPYRVLSILGAGGMGLVFQAEDPNLKRFVALKVMQPGLAANDIARQRFLREARATAALAHDNIVSIHQVGEDRGIPYFVMPLLEGETLDGYLARLGESLMPLGEILRIAKEIADGLSAAHDLGVIHRDVKPSNIWLEGERRRVKIVDFGLARERYSDVKLTQTGKVVGTPGFMSPEQVENKTIDQRSDLFSLGCVLYLLATGKDAFYGETVFDTIRAVVQDVPPPIDPPRKLPDEFIALVMRLLAKRPSDRPLSAAEVSRTIQAIRKQLAKGAGKNKLPRTIPEAQPFEPASAKSRNLGALIIVGGFTLGLAVASFWLTSGSKQPAEFHVENIPADKDNASTNTNGAATPPAEITVDDTPKLKAAESKPKPKPALVDDKWVAEKSNLPSARRLQAVVQKLKELNPDYDGDYTRLVDPKSTNGAITRFTMSTDHVRIIWPIRAFTDLNGLHLNGSAPGKGMLQDLSALKGMKVRHLEIANNAVADYSPLKEMSNLETLRCDPVPGRNSQILQSISTLKRINDRPVKLFWKESVNQSIR